MFNFNLKLFTTSMIQNRPWISWVETQRQPNGLRSFGTNLSNFSHPDFNITRIDANLCDVEGVVAALYKQQQDILKGPGTGNYFNLKVKSFLLARNLRTLRRNNQLEALLRFIDAHPNNLYNRVSSKTWPKETTVKLCQATLLRALKHRNSLIDTQKTLNILQQECSKELLDFLTDLFTIYNADIFDNICSNNFVENVELLKIARDNVEQSLALKK